MILNCRREAYWLVRTCGAGVERGPISLLAPMVLSEENSTYSSVFMCVFNLESKKYLAKKELIYFNYLYDTSNIILVVYYEENFPLFPNSFGVFSEPPIAPVLPGVQLYMHFKVHLNLHTNPHSCNGP